MSSTLVAQSIDAWKVARLAVVDGHLPGQYVPRLCPLTASVLVTLDAEAVCLPGTTAGTIEHAPRDTPHVDCRCGYYAKPARLTPAVISGHGTQAALSVELSGRVVEHDDTYGRPVYRAQRQRVVAIELPDVCACGLTAVAVRGRHALDRAHLTVARILEPVCVEHDRDGPRWNIADLAALFGVDVTWTDAYRSGLDASAFGQIGAAAQQVANAFGAAMAQLSASMGVTTQALASMHRVLLDADLVAEPPDESRRDGETVLEWKARRDNARRQQLDSLYGSPRPARHAPLGRETRGPRR